MQNTMVGGMVNSARRKLIRRGKTNNLKRGGKGE